MRFLGFSNYGVPIAIRSNLPSNKIARTDDVSSETLIKIADIETLFNPLKNEIVGRIQKVQTVNYFTWHSLTQS